MSYKNFKDAKEYKAFHSRENANIYKCASWRRKGIKLREGEDWDSVWIHYYITEECEDCGCKLTWDKKMTATRKCLDHDHQTGFIRGVVCCGCNNRRAEVDKTSK